jgi:dipeptidyl aminopeptidase/acylaminoacyl peptidase
MRALAPLAACALALAAASAARADVFSPISLVSYGAIDGGAFVQQAEYAHDSAISANGRYVVFDGSIGGISGVWRRDLDTDALAEVAGGDAAMPSISEEGRYVSFTTDEGASLPEITHAQPDSAPRREAVQVYRRDMDVEPAASAEEEEDLAPSERAFLAASVRSGSLEPLRYADAKAESGSYAAGRSAISANGMEVAFVTAAVSNLVAYPALEAEEAERGEAPAPHTPSGQVAVHSFDTGTTELVSRCRFECGRGAAEGAAEPVVVSEAESKLVGAANVGAAKFPEHEPDGAWPGASISADGSTVAWTGENIAQQAPTLPDEDLEAIYEEPLWHRLPAAANDTRRVTGGSDPEAPGCAASGEAPLVPGDASVGDPCQGPFLREPTGSTSGSGLNKGSRTDFTPRLSANGEEVAFGANARLVTEGEDYGRGEEGNHTDLFVASMQPGLTRVEALTPLTQVGPPGVEPESAEVTDYEISPDGEQVAFTTARTLFTLGSPTLVTAPPGEMGISELYDADIADGTLTRVTHGFEGEGEQSEQPYHLTSQATGDPYRAYGASELGALTPDFSGDGDELVFTSTAANLVYGDGNSPSEPVDCCVRGDGSDVFAVTRERFLSEPAPQSISPAPTTAIAPQWLLDATAAARADGSVVVYAEVPAAGRLQLSARARIVVAPAAKPAARRSRSARTTGKLLTRTLATDATSEAAPAGGLVSLVVHVEPRYAGLTARAGGVSASLELTFTSAAGPTLHRTLAVVFKRTRRAGKAKRTAAKPAVRAGKRR